MIKISCSADNLLLCIQTQADRKGSDYYDDYEDDYYNDNDKADRDGSGYGGYNGKEAFKK